MGLSEIVVGWHSKSQSLSQFLLVDSYKDRALTVVPCTMVHGCPLLLKADLVCVRGSRKPCAQSNEEEGNPRLSFSACRSVEGWPKWKGAPLT